MANIKQTVLTKKIDGVVYSLYPKTSADIVEFKSTTVAAELTSLAEDLEAITKESGTIDTKVKTACDNLYNKIMGLTDEDTTIDEAYDTLKEVAEWIDTHGDVAAAFRSDITTLQADLASLTNRVETLETVVGDEESGLVHDVAANTEAIGDASKGLVKGLNDVKEAIVSLGGNVEGLHTPQLYTATGDTTDVEGAVAGLADAEFGDGDVLVITDANGISAAYQFDADNDVQWGALDGNVSADNVIIKNDITLAGSYTAVGNVTKSQNGTGTLAASGKSLSNVLTSIFTKELQPTKTEPAVSLTTPKAGEYEVGTMVTPTYTASLSAGSYTYGPATGVVAKAWNVTNTDGASLETANGSFDEIQVGDATNYKITATATYDAGAVATTNLGNASSPTVQITAGSKNKVSSAITGYRKSFYGSKVTPVELTSGNIRALAGSGKSTVTSFNVTVVEGAKQVIIAVPTGKTLSKVEDVGAFGTDIAASFVNETVAVEGANGYATKDYNVYVYTPATALGANTYKVTIK